MTDMTANQPTDWRALCADQLPELRGMFERILCVARSSGGPTVGNIQLADRLIDAVVSWSATALAQPEPQGPTDEEIDDQFFAHCYTDDFGNELMEIQQFRKGARTILARLGRPAIKPVPVAEPLPGPHG
jgi:hypothetical protein